MDYKPDVLERKISQTQFWNIVLKLCQIVFNFCTEINFFVFLLHDDYHFALASTYVKSTFSQSEYNPPSH